MTRSIIIHRASNGLIAMPADAAPTDLSRAVLFHESSQSVFFRDDILKMMAEPEPVTAKDLVEVKNDLGEATPA